MLKENYAEYDRNKSRGIPREGAALLHGMVYCGKCGHKMVVQYKNSVRYICNHLRQQLLEPICQYIPCTPIDEKVVEAFFTAISPNELDVYAQVLEKQKQSVEQLRLAHRQKLERLKYQAALAQRQFNQVDPDNRLVAGELEKNWESALRELREAETLLKNKSEYEEIPTISRELKEHFKAIGQKLPGLWKRSVIGTSHQKALLRSLIDKVVVHRSTRDQVQTRIVWKGGQTTTFIIPVNVGSLAELPMIEEMEQVIVTLSKQGISDEEIAENLTRRGHRSPSSQHVLPSTVKSIRLKQGILQKRSQSHKRKIPGYLTVPQLAELTGIAKHWIYDRIHNKTIKIHKCRKTGLYLFPDNPDTVGMLKRLKQGLCSELDFLSIGEH